MSPKLDAQQRLKLIEKVILHKEPVAKICRENNISRVIFYRWLKRYLEADKNAQSLEPKVKSEASTPNRVNQDLEAKILEIIINNPNLSCRSIYQKLPLNGVGQPIIGYHGVQNVMSRLNLSTKEERLKYSQNISRSNTGVTEYNYLTPEQKQAILDRVLINKEQVSEACKEYGLSRTAFYNLKRRYLQAPTGEKEEALERKKTEVARYWRQTPEEYEKAVLSLVSKHPEFGIRKLLNNLPQVAGVPIVSHHGIQNILRRNDLSLYEQRLAYAQDQVTPSIRLIQRWETEFAKLFTLPQEKRASLVRFVGTFSLTIFLTIIVLGGLGFLITASGGLSVILRPGMIFASISLLIGTIFFAYSMKYYLSLALVLSFTSQNREIGISGSIEKRNSSGGWLSKIFNSSQRGNQTDFPEENLQGRKGIGLQASLDHVEIERYPFISIHLPFYNEKKVANRIISACTSFDYPNYEVIVCDDSTDETVDIVNEWKNHPRIKILHRPTRKGYKGGALSYALKAMDPKTEFVCVFDADFVPYPDTLIQFVKYFKASGGWKEDQFCKAESIVTMPYDTFDQPKLSSEEQAILTSQEEELRKKGNTAVVAGYQWHVLNKSENWVTRGVRTEYAGSYVVERPGQEIMGAMKIIHGSVYCMRADVLKHFGWGTSITEDYELTLRIYEKGFKVCYTPYIQAPSECVSTIKRLIRQRMRWAEGHSFNTRKMFKKLMFGYWEGGESKNVISNYSNYSNYSNQIPNPKSQLDQLEIRSIRNSKRWVPSPLTLAEKIEFAFLTPYYLQAFLFIIGTTAWLLSEVVFKVRLPFWTALWGWSLILTNFLALPLLNAIGLFLEESEEKDYLGIFSFMALCYIVVPFQAYAAVKGFVEEKEGPWFRTPKTGTITDILTRGRFYRWLTDVLKWKPSIGGIATSNLVPAPVINGNFNSYLALSTANNRFNQFSIPKTRRLSWITKVSLAILLSFSTTLLYFSQSVQVVNATPMAGPLKLSIGAANAVGETWPTGANFLQNTTSASTGVGWIFSPSVGNYQWYTNLLPTGDDPFIIPAGQYNLNIARTLNLPVNNKINFAIQLVLNNSDGSGQNVILSNTTYYIYNSAGTMQGNIIAVNTLYALGIGSIPANITYSTPYQRLGLNLYVISGTHTTRSNIRLLINNSSRLSALSIPSNIEVPEIPNVVIFIFLMAIMPGIPGFMSGRYKKEGQNILEEFGLAWKDFVKKLLGRGEEFLDKLPV